jgi:hypothetical protein
MKVVMSPLLYADILKEPAKVLDRIKLEPYSTLSKLRVRYNTPRAKIRAIKRMVQMPGSIWLGDRCHPLLISLHANKRYVLLQNVSVKDLIGIMRKDCNV